MEKEFTEGDAFVAAYSEYFGVVYKEALKYSGNHHIAEEIAQDAFFTAYIQCGSESKQQIRTWMLMFARYRAMNYIRDHKREVPLAEITMSEDRYPNSLIDDSSEDQVVALLKEKCFRELGIDIFQELYQKNARWYKAVTLVYYADMPQKEVAKRMGITLNALEGILKRARKWMIKGIKISMTAYTIYKKQVGCTATCFLYQSMQEKLPVAGSLHIRSMNENASGLVSGSSLDQINDGVDRILLRRILHGLNICFTILIQVHDRIKKNIMIKFFLFKNDTVALALKRTGI